LAHGSSAVNAAVAPEVIMKFKNRKIIYLNLMNLIFDIFYKFLIKRNTQLWNIINETIEKSESTGCSYVDYYLLYSDIRKHRPKEVLECGGGITTVIIAYALLENEREGYLGRVTSMESKELYFKSTKNLIPDRLTKYVDLVLSPIIEDHFSIFRGVRYKQIPADRPYDFIYVDGPEYVAPSDNTISFNFDYLYIVMNSHIPVRAIIDKRVSTCYVMQKIFGTHKVRYNSFLSIGRILPCSVSDIKTFDPITPSSAFNDSFSFLGNSELSLKFNNRYKY